MVTTPEIKVAVASYFRYRLQCPIVAFESATSDVVVVDSKGRRVEIEVKTSIEDLKADNKKTKHHYYRLGEVHPIHPTAYFYFAVPMYLCDKALEVVESMYSYAGLFGVYDFGTEKDILQDVVCLKRKASPLALTVPKLNLYQLGRIIKDQSGTLIRESRRAIQK